MFLQYIKKLIEIIMSEILEEETRAQLESRKRFIREGQRRFGDRYDYSEVVMGKNWLVPVTIKCRTFGETFKIKPRNHIRSQSGGSEYWKMINTPPKSNINKLK